jgi:hypothetical protein
VTVQRACAAIASVLANVRAGQGADIGRGPSYRLRRNRRRRGQVNCLGDSLGGDAGGHGRMTMEKSHAFLANQAKGFHLPDFYSGTTDPFGRFQ